MDIVNTNEEKQCKRGRPRKYDSDEERDTARREYEKAYKKEYNKKHPELKQKYNKTYYLKKNKINISS